MDYGGKVLLKKVIKLLTVPVLIIILYFILQFLLLNIGNVHIPSEIRYLVIILCLVVSAYNAFKQNRSDHL